MLSLAKTTQQACNGRFVCGLSTVDDHRPPGITLRALIFLLSALAITSCSTAPATSPSPSSTLAPTTAGSVSEIGVVVFKDLNQNGARDSNEPGVADLIGLAPDTDCTIGDPAVILPAETDPATGEYTFTDLVPGLYCVMYRGSQPLTTEPAYTLTLATGERAEVFFGIKP